MRRRTFKIKSNSSKVDKEQITNKGQETEVLEVDIEDVRSCLRSLRKVAQTPIIELKGEDKSNFDTIVNYVNCFYSSGNYDSLHRVIKEEFKDCNTLSPGTVAGYMVGSIACSDPCNPVCVNSAPANSNYTTCQERVLLATRCQGGYSFTSLNQMKSEKAILYIPDNKFPGLNQKEKEELLALGVFSCHVKSYNNGGKQRNLTSGYISVENLENREGILPEKAPEVFQEQKNSYNLAFILLIIVIVLVLLFVAWKVWY